MTIKEIAQLAGVSVSTVSKIMNGKDSSISAKTREHVLQIAKDYNYSPYASAITPQTKTLTIGVIFRDTNSVRTIASSILKEATHRGYSILLRESDRSRETELKNISALLAAHVDGIIWEPVEESSLEYLIQLDKANIPCCTFHCGSDSSFNLDFRAMGYLATLKLVQNHHTRIACLSGTGRRSEAFYEGYRSCLFENQLPLQQELIFTDIDQLPASGIASHVFSGIVICRYEDALKLYQMTDTLHYSVPDDISMISLREDSAPDTDYPVISALTIPYAEFGSMLTRHLVSKIEKQEPETDTELCFALNGEDTIGLPYSSRRKRVLSIGSINIDNYLKFETLPKTGRTATSTDFSTYPGGKCINEAIGVAKLGHNVSIIGRVGNDSASDMIYQSIKDFKIDSSGLKRSNESMTGQAYIFVQKNGDSMISILSGANNMMSAQDIQSNERLFLGASHCLIQTEIPMPAIVEAAKLAKKHRLITILKPSSCSILPEALLRNVDIMIPNVEELNELCSENLSEEEKARRFLDYGIQTVIITKGSKGCCIYEADRICQIPATDFLSVDNTGAGDAFISALVSYLIYGYDMVAAARIATYAAGFSITKQGVSTSLIDKSTLEAYLKMNEPGLLKNI